MDFANIIQDTGWITAGALILFCVAIALFIAEFMFPSFGLFGFAGLTALLIGAIQIHQTGAFGEDFFLSQKMLSNAIGFGAILTGWGAYLTYRLHKKRPTTGVEAMIGETAWIMKWRGKRGRVWVPGEQWAAFSDETHNFKRGDETTIEAIEGLKIKIKAKETDNS